LPKGANFIGKAWLEIAARKSAGEDTTRSERRVLDMVKGWMLLQDQRQKAVDADLNAVHQRNVEPPSLSKAR
jgi:hypothetical protein